MTEHGGDTWAYPGIELDFSVSLHPLGMPAAVRAAVADHVGDYAAYPDPFCRELTAAIAAREGVPAGHVLCGNGASDLIYRLCLALLPRRVATLAPTYSEYARAAGLVGADVVTGVGAAADVTFICQPNNPTGTLIDVALLHGLAEVCQAAGTWLVVDECFLPFTTGESVVALTAEYPHLVVLRAFTKLYAMAGLRLGYLVTSDGGLVEAVRRAGSYWPVNAVAQVAGLAALGVEGWAEATPGLVAAEREYLARELSALGHAVLPSDANFLLVRSDWPVAAALRERGILVRDCSNFEGLDAGYWRIGVKTRPENERLVEVLRDKSTLSS
jgi:threonine-phosphate decarboxylase